MPIPKYDGSPENEWIPKCMHDMPAEYEQQQALAICYNQMDENMSLEKLAGIPIEIVGDNEEKILEYLPDVKSHEMEHDYLPRCVPVLYPEYVDQQKATSLCADKYQRVITVSDKRRTNMKTMKPTENKFERNRISFLSAVAEAEMRSEGILLAEEGKGSFPWSECQAKMMEQYGDKDIADKVCGMIRSKYGS